LLFKLPAAGNEDFFSLPFPNDIRRKDGHVDVSGFPTPPSYAVPADLVGAYVSAINSSQTDFGPNQTVFMRFSQWPLKCEAGCAANNSCAAGCFGTGEPEQIIYVVDITDPANDAFSPIWYGWVASSGQTPYLCPNWLAVVPQYRSGWVPGHTYTVFVHSRLRGKDGDAMVQDADFAALLSTTAPSEAVALSAWNAYAPLRAWLAANPTYPKANAGDPDVPVVASDLGGATVFTIGVPSRVLEAMATTIAEIGRAHV
jgi:hypothetical protein